MHTIADVLLESPSTSQGSYAEAVEAAAEEEVQECGQTTPTTDPSSPSRRLIAKPQTARDRERLDAGKQALRELLHERRLKKQSKTSCASVLKVYVTITAAILLIGGIFVLIFLIPMTIDPALATLAYDIDPQPAMCLTVSSKLVNPTKEKTWCSCSEGCTREVYSCQQISVAYRKRFLQLSPHLQLGFNVTAFQIQNPNLAHSVAAAAAAEEVANCQSKDWVFDETCWHHLNASLLVNIKGCGYPPHVNCSLFLQSYNTTGRRFLCYYSRLNPSIVITNYNPAKPWHDLILSLGWSCGSQILGAFLLIVLHCPFRSAWKTAKSKATKHTYDLEK